jgi:hypothetical protein
MSDERSESYSYAAPPAYSENVIATER